MKHTDPGLVLSRLDAFLASLHGLRRGAILLYVETYLVDSDDTTGLVQARSVRQICNGEDFEADLCAAGLWERVTDDFGTVVAYRFVSP